LGRLTIGLTAIFVALICLGAEYVRVNRPFFQEISARNRDRNVGPRVTSNVELAKIAHMGPMEKIRLVVSDQNGCLQNNQIERTSIREQIAQALGVQVSDTASNAPLVTLTVYERSAAPFSFRTLILTKITMVTAKSGDNGGGTLVYSDEHSDIYAGLKGSPLRAAIDKAISRLQATVAAN
jgi:hypothetical protein